MTSHTSFIGHAYDVIVIGAGAAGLAATRMLQHEGCKVLTLEARDRLGGRILTDWTFASYPVELGAEFIHGKNVHTWELIRSAGIRATEVFSKPERYFFYADGALLPLPKVSSTANGVTAIGALSLTGRDLYAAITRRREQGLPDIDVGSLLRSLGVSPDTDWGRIVQCSYQGLNASDPAELSAFSLEEAAYPGDGEEDFQIDDGYSTWLEFFADDLPVRLLTPVELIRWEPDGVEVTTRQGDIFRARRLIVTCPLALLQKGWPKFIPPLPAFKLHALKLLGSGPVTKVLLRFDRPFWPDEMERAAIPQTPLFLFRNRADRPDEQPTLTIYVGASAAKSLNRLAPEKAVDAVVAELRSAFGLAGDPKVVASRFVDWAADPFAGLGYSFVRPGGVGARALLAAPVDEVLFWAGEATNPVRPATVHGAMESGVRAADEVLRIA
ncbi:MAG TPA: NAD(P)/FAD-dependent oxidoreductase [Chthoniobacterales bacterium]|jgi:monoamine oxidase|nr:NAD(P)/FAD-dependent oxidoreductase [Chthoniobacterales bacterium]